MVRLSFYFNSILHPIISAIVIVNDNGDTVEVSKQKDGKKTFHMTDGEWGETVGLILGNGTQMLLSYKKDCIIDPDSRYEMDKMGKSQATQCMAAVYELNGKRGKNKYGEDVVPFNALDFGGSSCAFEVGNTCYATAPFEPTPITKAECEALPSSYGIKACRNDSDYWAGAVKQCGGVNKLPSEQQLAELAQKLYNNSSISATYAAGLYQYGTLNLGEYTTALSSLFSSWYSLWSSAEYSAGNAYSRGFTTTGTGRSNNPRNGSTIRAVCVGE